jgi:polyphosphate glucokinase
VIDIGGSGIKMMVLDDAGRPLTERARVKTPRPATPTAVLRAIADLAAQQMAFDRVSAGFPGVVRDGVTLTAPNLHPDWVGYRLASALAKRLRKPARVANDADVQGLGAVSGRGVELTITLGTGVGSALFLNGVLVPNLELGHHPFDKGRTYEDLLGNAALDRAGEAKWNRRLRRAIRQLAALINYDHLYIGGGNARLVSRKPDPLPANVTTVPNEAGLLGGIALWRGARERR